MNGEDDVQSNRVLLSFQRLEQDAELNVLTRTDQALSNNEQGHRHKSTRA